MKLSTLINALRAIHMVNLRNGIGDAVVWVANDDGKGYGPMAEIRCLTPEDDEPGIPSLHFVGADTPEFWPGMAQFHVRKDGSTRSIIPHLNHDKVTQTQGGEVAA